MKAGAAMCFTRYGAIGKSKELKPEQRCIFFKGGGDGGRKRQSSPPPMISYWTWQIGCSVAMDARQSLSSSANRA